MRLMVLLTLVLMSFSARAANVATSSVTNQGNVKKWHILLDANHQAAMREDQVAYTNFTAFLDYQLNKENSFRILQAPTKFYEVVEGQNEWSPSDTILYHFWNTGRAIGPTKLRWVTSVALPTSEESQNNDKIMTVTGSLQATAMLRGNIMLSAQPYVRYNWYEFKTSVSGTPLAATVAGINLISNYQITTKLSVNAAAGYSVINNYASQFQSSRAGINTGSRDGRYFFSVGTNYEYTDKVAVYLSYSQGDTYIRDGRYELYTYDPVVSRIGIGATLFF